MDPDPERFFRFRIHNTAASPFAKLPQRSKFVIFSNILVKTLESVADSNPQLKKKNADPDPKHVGMIFALSNVLSGCRLCLFYFLILGTSTEPTLSGINTHVCLINYKTNIKLKNVSFLGGGARCGEWCDG